MLNESAEYALKIIHELGPFMEQGQSGTVAIPSERLYMIAANYLALYKEANSKHSQSKVYQQSRLIH